MLIALLVNAGCVVILICMVPQKRGVEKAREQRPSCLMALGIRYLLSVLGALLGRRPESSYQP